MRTIFDLQFGLTNDLALASLRPRLSIYFPKVSFKEDILIFCFLSERGIMIEISRLVGYILTVTSFTLLITSIFVTQIQLAYTQANMNNTTNSKDIQNNLLIANIMAKNLENRIQKAGAILEITGKLPQVRDVPYANLLNQTLNTLHGISENSDVDKRKIAQDILSNDKDFGAIFFLMANGDVYLVEPYKRQLNLTTNNLSFRDYYNGAVNTGGTYLGNVIKSASTGLPQVNIAAFH
jgi:hypothetical protein